MIQRRYTEQKELIQHADELELTGGRSVLLYRGNQWLEEVSVDLGREADRFEALRPYLLKIGAALSGLDASVQKYSALYGGDSRFSEHYYVADMGLEGDGVLRLTYFGSVENTEFDVCFQDMGDRFLLRSYGMKKEIPPDWEEPS